MSRFGRHIFYCALCTVVIAIGAPVVFKFAIQAAAANRAAAIEADLPAQPPTGQDELAAQLAARLNRVFVKADSGGGIPLLMKLGHLLSHRFVPRPLRADASAVDMAFLYGICDGAARALDYLLARHGFTSQQLNLIAPEDSHTVSVAQTSDGRLLMLDAYYGVVPRSSGRILAPSEALRPAPGSQVVWTPLLDSSDLRFYKASSHIDFARQGESLVIEVTLRLDPSGELVIGREDGSSDDVSIAGAKAGLTPYWNYIGSRYDRAWVRVIKFTQDTIVSIKTVAPPDPGMITSDVRPTVISGSVLVYKMKAGDSLRFVDGRSAYDWLHLRSYQDIDVIRFEADKA